MGSPIYAPTEWRFSVLGPVLGNWKKITILSSLADEVELLYQLNRPTMLTFSVPSDNPQVNILHTDGLPFITVGPRWVLGWRKSPSSLAPTPGGWELKFAGRIWAVQDQGDGTTSRTMVTCFDPLKHLEKRIIRAADGTYRKQIKFWGSEGATGTSVIKTLIDRTQTFKGTCRIDTAGGHWVDTGEATVAVDQGYVWTTVQNLTDTGGVDLDPTPLDGSDGDFLQLGGCPRLGSDKPNTVIGYAAPPRRATNFDRTTTLDNLANYVGLFGKSSKGFLVEQEDTDSQDLYDTFEEVSVISDVENKELLTLLAEEEIFLRKDPYDLVSITPTPEDSPRFFNEYFLGDTITVKASTQPFPDTRATLNALQRVYGARINLDPEYGEHVTDLIVSSQAESA